MISNAFFSKSCKTKAAIIGESGEPIGVPNFCLYIIIIKTKNVEFKINCKIMKNSSFGMSTLLDMCV